MKAILVLLLIGALCVFSHKHQSSPPSPGAASGSAAPPTTSSSNDKPIATVPHKVHNRVLVTFDGQDHDGWMFLCPIAQLEDSPAGCAATPTPIMASNSTKAKQLCNRKCKLSPSSSALLELAEVKHSVKIEVSSYDQPHSHHAKCELTWSADKYLAGYDLKIHYLWVDHIEVPFIEIKKCEAEAIESPTPLKSGDMFVDSRELILDDKINFLATVLSLTLLALAMAMCCCACTFLATCVCFKLCAGKSSKRARRSAARRDAENVEMAEMPVSKSVDVSAAPQVPVYIPYYMINPYSASMFAQQQGEQTFVMPNAPQQL
jgi:hypothetical protein